jgi:hypothetical protein
LRASGAHLLGTFPSGSQAAREVLVELVVEPTVATPTSVIRIFC